VVDEHGRTRTYTDEHGLARTPTVHRDGVLFWIRRSGPRQVKVQSVKRKGVGSGNANVEYRTEKCRISKGGGTLPTPPEATKDMRRTFFLGVQGVRWRIDYWLSVCVDILVIREMDYEA